MIFLRYLANFFAELDIRGKPVPLFYATSKIIDMQGEGLNEISKISNVHDELIRHAFTQTTVLREKILEIQSNALFRILQSLTNDKIHKTEAMVALRTIRKTGEVIRIRTKLMQELEQKNQRMRE